MQFKYFDIFKVNVNYEMKRYINLRIRVTGGLLNLFTGAFYLYVHDEDKNATIGTLSGRDETIASIQKTPAFEAVPFIEFQFNWSPQRRQMEISVIGNPGVSNIWMYQKCLHKIESALNNCYNNTEYRYLSVPELKTHNFARSPAPLSQQQADQLDNQIEGRYRVTDPGLVAKVQEALRRLKLDYPLNPVRVTMCRETLTFELLPDGLYLPGALRPNQNFSFVYLPYSPNKDQRVHLSEDDRQFLPEFNLFVAFNFIVRALQDAVNDLNATISNKTNTVPHTFRPFDLRSMSYYELCKVDNRAIVNQQFTLEGKILRELDFPRPDYYLGASYIFKATAPLFGASEEKPERLRFFNDSSTSTAPVILHRASDIPSSDDKTEEVIKLLKCPLKGHIMKDPVMIIKSVESNLPLSDNITVDMSSIEPYLPYHTGVTLRPNMLVRKMIQAMYPDMKLGPIVDSSVGSTPTVNIAVASVTTPVNSAVVSAAEADDPGIVGPSL